jgi:hypothetical protein
MHTVPVNYQKNVDVLKQNFNRGMTAGQALGVISNLRSQFISANLYGDDEVAFINAMLVEVEKYTCISLTEVA